MKRPSLAVQILIGLVLGVIVGAAFYGNPAVANVLQPLGDIFIRLIKMIVVPIVLSTLIVGVAGVGDTKKLGRLGGLTLVYFEVVTTGAILFGLLLANLFQPGRGVNLGELTKTDISKYTEGAHAATSHSFADTFVNIVPTNVVDAFARGDMLAIIFFAVFFGLGLGALGERGKPLLNMFQLVADTMFWVTNQIMKLAPIGVFALIGVTVSKFGVQSLIPLGKLVLVVYGAMLAFVLLILGTVARFAGTSILTLIRVLRDELTLAYSTASSETVLPRIMQKMEAFGCPKYITSFVIPTGYSFNLDGSTLYQSIAALFIAQLYGIHMPLEKQVLLVLTLMLTSKGIAGVPGVSFVVLLATLGTVGIPVEGLAFIAGIDRILDMARTAVNVCGNSLAAVVMSRLDGTFDQRKARQYLADMQAGALPPLVESRGH
ncbi:cation:dicarboxylate symporter family transporter [Deinococcus aluminii]|uniref:Proton/sodium-glutamate symport protein n=1 Tax=Deinococcus aluminii TaxID=1656885 RepID=A0ABP9XH00_9DEIO